MRKTSVFTMSLLAGLQLAATANAKTLNCIALTTPITRPYYATHACLDNVDWRPASKQFAARLSYGYVDGTTWQETGDRHSLAENKPAVADNPNTPENEAKPADPAYDRAMSAVKANLPTRSLDKIVLDILQASGGPAGTIVELTLP